MFIFYSICATLVFTQMTHPLAMGLMLLVQTVFISILTGTMAQSFWFSYVLFLVFLGGLLVLFIYVTSLASNEMFSLSMSTLAPIFIVSASLFLILIILDSSLINLSINNFEGAQILNSSLYQEEALNSLTKLYNGPTSLITLTLVLYLFLALIAVVKITKINQGPLRQSN
uniref:NADH-ubiquinone oxidoreductase chain 6 n=1 Tax=Mesonemoura metafiligera TaxID=2605687 RepID=A0A5B9XWD4_9NEOP|nr:NADH dehydrogenase subunit 6 [Mesonemoura metafiligera]QEH58823.1 NADH dehydrogenase subunit 6 [Mesonemoura metafiligera]